jgi:hypothetical protein
LPGSLTTGYNKKPVRTAGRYGTNGRKINGKGMKKILSWSIKWLIKKSEI